MPRLLILLAVAVFLQAAPSCLVIGKITAVFPNKIEVRDGTGKHVLYSEPSSEVWRGQDYHDFSALRVNDDVMIRCRTGADGRDVVVGMYANLGKVEGRITHVDQNGFQVDQNYNADPQSGYRRGLRQILYDTGTQWDQSLPEDLRAGRDVFVMGLKLPGGELRASRITVYEGRRPVRMAPGARIIDPNGQVH